VYESSGKLSNLLVHNCPSLMTQVPAGNMHPARALTIDRQADSFAAHRYAVDASRAGYDQQVTRFGFNPVREFPLTLSVELLGQNVGKKRHSGQS
jgi:hypothetical protein